MTLDARGEIDCMAALYRSPDRSGDLAQLRTPPMSIAAEQAVLGSLLLSPHALPKVQDWLSAEDFYRRDHQLIYSAVLEFAGKRKPFDPVTLGEWFDAQGLGQEVQGGAYLIELASTQGSAANVVAYAEIVKEKSELRNLINIGTEAVDAGYAPEGRNARELSAEMQRALVAMGSASRMTGPRGMREIGLAWFSELERRYNGESEMLGLRTPWARFNSMTAGLKPGELIVVAGRPSMGKSAWAINTATVNALNGKRVVMFSLEMTAESIYNRAAAAVAEVPLSWLRSPRKGEHWAEATAAVSTLRDASLMIDDTPGLRIEQIMTRARREHMRSPLDMVVVDHLHLMPLPGKTRETVEIGNITRDLKGLSKELGCPVLVLAQLNRSVESRDNKRPRMSDLRESGNIEQDADLIVFLYRDDYYAERDGRASSHPGMLEMIISKQREGETGSVWARSRLDIGQIADAEDYEPPEFEPPSSRKRARWTSGPDRASGAE